MTVPMTRDEYYDALSDYRLRKLVLDPAVRAMTFGVNPHAGPHDLDTQNYLHEQAELDAASRRARNIFPK